MRLVARLSSHIERGLILARPESRLLIPGVTFAATSAIHLITYLFPQITTSLALPFLVFIIAAFWWGNLISALLGAAVLSVYTAYQSGFDPWRGVQLIAASVLGAFLVVAVREALIHQIKEAERARRVENLVNAADKTLIDLKDEYLKVAEVVQGWSALTDQARFEFIVEHRGKFANIIQAGLGYHQLWLERKEILEGERDG